MQGRLDSSQDGMDYNNDSRSWFHAAIQVLPRFYRRTCSSSIVRRAHAEQTKGTTFQQNLELDNFGQGFETIPAIIRPVFARK